MVRGFRRPGGFYHVRLGWLGPGLELGVYVVYLYRHATPLYQVWAAVVRQLLWPGASSSQLTANSKVAMKATPAKLPHWSYQIWIWYDHCGNFVWPLYFGIQSVCSEGQGSNPGPFLLLHFLDLVESLSVRNIMLPVTALNMRMLTCCNVLGWLGQTDRARAQDRRGVASKEVHACMDN